MTSAAAFAFDHVDRMCDERGMFEHADRTEPRTEHGYCTDDNARLLVVTSREPDTESAHRLAHLSLAFVLEAQRIDGTSRNRMDHAGHWSDAAGTDDCWGRSLWGLGSAAVHHTDPDIRRSARRGFDCGVKQRSRWPRAMGFAAIGAAEVLASEPEHNAARAMLVDALAAIGGISTGAWSWPEPRLAYANAALAEAVIAAGSVLGRAADVERGLAMLAWLLDRETPNGHLSVTPVGGSGPGDRGPGFDQQPIEVAAMADACWRAHRVTGQRAWSGGVATAAAWFNGHNDVGLTMFDQQSGGAYDGLQHDSVNLNQGAESTLAFISTMQRARSLVPAA